MNFIRKLKANFSKKQRAKENRNESKHKLDKNIYGERDDENKQERGQASNTRNSEEVIVSYEDELNTNIKECTFVFVNPKDFDDSISIASLPSVETVIELPEKTSIESRINLSAELKERALKPLRYYGNPTTSAWKANFCKLINETYKSHFDFKPSHIKSVPSSQEKVKSVTHIATSKTSKKRKRCTSTKKRKGKYNKDQSKLFASLEDDFKHKCKNLHSDYRNTICQVVRTGAKDASYTTIAKSFAFDVDTNAEKVLNRAYSSLLKMKDSTQNTEEEEYDSSKKVSDEGRDLIIPRSVSIRSEENMSFKVYENVRRQSSEFQIKEKLHKPENSSIIIKEQNATSESSIGSNIDTESSTQHIDNVEKGDKEEINQNKKRNTNSGCSICSDIDTESSTQYIESVEKSAEEQINQNKYLIKESIDTRTSSSRSINEDEFIKSKDSIEYSKQHNVRKKLEQIPEASTNSVSGLDFNAKYKKRHVEICVAENAEIFNLNLVTLEPLQGIVDYVNKNNEFITYTFQWTFLNYSDSYSFEISKNRTERLHCERSYNFTISNDTYLYLSKVNLALEFAAISEFGNTVLLAKGNLNLDNALKNVGKLQEATIQVNNRDLSMCYQEIDFQIFGNLKCKYSMQGDPAVFKSVCPLPPVIRVMESLGSGSYLSLLSPTPKYSKYSIDDVISVNDSELQAFQDGLHLVLIRNKALKTKQHQISNELKERTMWMHEELKWRRTLQENAILSGKNPEVVKWRQWRDKKTGKVKYRPQAPAGFNNVASFKVTIIEIQLNPFCYVMTNKKILRIYVEFTFLQYSGVELETPSIDKPDDDAPLVYDFSKTFEFSSTDKEAKLLGEAIRNKDCIVFTAVSEPLDVPNEYQTCTPIGNTEVNIFNLLQNYEDEVTEFYPLFDYNSPGTELGKLKIQFSGIAYTRSLALNILNLGAFNLPR